MDADEAARRASLSVEARQESDVQLVTGGRDRVARVWDPATSTCTRILAPPTGDTILAVAISPDGSLVATAGADKVVRVWNPETGIMRRQLEGHASSVSALAFSPDSKFLATAGRDRDIILWRVRFAKETKRFEAGAQGAINGLSFSPDGKMLASAGSNKTVRLWRVRSARMERECVGHERAVTCVAYAPDGRCLASGSQDKRILIWAPRTGQMLRTLFAHQDAVLSISWSPNGSHLVSSSADGNVFIWDADTGTERAALLGHERAVTCVAYSPDGFSIASGGLDGVVFIHDATTGLEVRMLRGHEDHVMCLAYGKRTPPSGASAAGELLDAWTGARLDDDNSSVSDALLADDASARSIGGASRTSRSSGRSSRSGRSGAGMTFEGSRRTAGGPNDTLDRHGSLLQDYAIPEAIIPVPHEGVGKVRAAELHQLLNSSPQRVPDSAWLAVGAQSEIADRAMEDTAYMFYHQQHGVLYADDLAGLQSGKIMDAITAGGFWLDVHTSSQTDARLIADVFGIHPLTVEDIFNGEEREKCEFYEGYTFIAISGLAATATPSQLDVASVYLVACDQYVITMHAESKDLPTPRLLARLAKMGKHMKVNSAWLLWSILDQIIDQYIPIVSAMEEECEAIDELTLTINSSEHQDLLQRIWKARKGVTQMLRLLSVKTVLLRTLTTSPERADAFVIAPDAVLYLNDILDHVQAMEQTLNNLSETLNRSQGNYLAQVSIELAEGANNQNDLMKRLTSIAGVMMPLTLIAGIWGMNTAVPGVNEVAPFFYILLAMAILAAIICYIFYKYHMF